MLCEPVSYTGPMSVLATTSVQQGHLVLRYVATDNDIPFIVDLLKRETARDWDGGMLLESFRESFGYIASSQASQAFLVRLDGESLFEIEIHEARKQIDLHPAFKAGEGDFFIILLAGVLDQAASPVYQKGVSMCIDYFFSFPEVRRIIAPVYVGLDSVQRAKLFEDAGAIKWLERGQSKEPDLYQFFR